MKMPINMIESPALPRPDRLAAFFSAFNLKIEVAPADAPNSAANLVIAGAGLIPRIVRFCPVSTAYEGDDLLAAVLVDFGGHANPLVGALPAAIDANLADHPVLAAMVGIFLSESSAKRCGHRALLDRLGEMIVLLMLREAIETAATTSGLLAGLSHAALHRAIVAMHGAPAKAWAIPELAAIAGLSRSRFMHLFPRVVGLTPAAYLSKWRMTLAARALARGRRVKSIAVDLGYGSAAAFSRAYTRHFGMPPIAMRQTSAARSSGLVVETADAAF
jgi:AraC-like DNA-binding protein